MSHPHEYLLREFKLSIDHLVPLTPPEITEEARKLYGELMADTHATERQIHQALVRIGKKEFPYRKAYAELCAGDEERRLQEAALKSLPADLAAKIQAVTEHGVHITDYVKSKLFEELPGEERLAIDQAILTAHDTINRQCDERAHERQQTFEELVAYWTTERERLQALIDQLRGMASRDAAWAPEIINKADQFEEGWSIVSRDPSEEEIRKELESWSTTLDATEGEENVLS